MKYLATFLLLVFALLTGIMAHKHCPYVQEAFGPVVKAGCPCCTCCPCCECCDCSCCPCQK